MDTSSKYHYGQIKTFDQYNHVIANAKDHLETLERLLTNTPYDFERSYVTPEHIKDLTDAINIQFHWLSEYYENNKQSVVINEQVYHIHWMYRILRDGLKTSPGASLERDTEFLNGYGFKSVEEFLSCARPKIPCIGDELYRDWVWNIIGW